MNFLKVNETGLNEIMEFLAKNHKKGGEHFTREMLKSWAKDAEFQISEGNPASVEIPYYDSVSGATVEYRISDAGITKTEIEQQKKDNIK